MSIPHSVILDIFKAFVVLDIVVLIMVVFQRLWRKHCNNAEDKMIRTITEFIAGNRTSLAIRNKKLFLDKFVQFSQSQSINRAMLEKIQAMLATTKLERFYLKRLKSLFKHRRIEASIFLGYLATDTAKNTLERSLVREKEHSVKLYIANALSVMQNSSSIQFLLDSLIDSPDWYQTKVHVLLADFGTDFYSHIESLLDTEVMEIRRAVIHFASVYISDKLKVFLLNQALLDDYEIKYEALKALGKLYFKALDDDKFLSHPDARVRNIAVEAMSNIPTQAVVDKIIPLLSNDNSWRYVVFSVSTIIQKNPLLIRSLLDRFYIESNKVIKDGIAEILSSKIEYFILKLFSDRAEISKKLILALISSKKLNGIIGFLNKNKNRELENELLAIIKDVLPDDDYLKKECSLYLDQRLAGKLKLTKIETEKIKKQPKREMSKIIFLYVILTVALFCVPVVFLCRYYPIDWSQDITVLLTRYVIDFNYYLVYYSSAINLFYIVILFFSFVGIFRQVRYWRLKKMSFLFKSNILPSISIIAPAYCEELNIIESANSLLNLRYPEYELIIVNDGSSDNTLNALIDYFELEKVDFLLSAKLKTQPVRGIYKSRNIPKLTVVDKVNGGKADSLNVGINIAKGKYFCGIDADSLLEEDALLKIVAETLDSSEEVVAAGGNIFPINSSEIDKGFLEKVHIPRNKIACLQTIEYIRAFMAGRVGWAYLNSLLIISGAFGLFKRNYIQRIGGYLTEQGVFHKDTVGEDMELVVRLKRYMLERNIEHRITYAYNANCWTEVPESLGILYRQRDRWQRGLIDILSFHRRLMFNPRYGRIGIFTLPYFFIFEFAGPLFEIQGYLMVLAAVFLGILNVKICLMLFISSILMGTFISLTSLYISEKQQEYFSLKEILVLVVYSVVENFGFRQLLSLWRVFGYFNAMKKPKGWGKMVRKGFSGKK